MASASTPSPAKISAAAGDRGTIGQAGHDCGGVPRPHHGGPLQSLENRVGFWNRSRFAQYVLVFDDDDRVGPQIFSKPGAPLPRCHQGSGALKFHPAGANDCDLMFTLMILSDPKHR
jgi:hypothetical protein